MPHSISNVEWCLEEFLINFIFFKNTFFDLRVNFLFFLKRRYALSPLILTAEAFGGICSLIPIKSFIQFLISFCFGKFFETFITWPSISSVSVCIPHLIVNIYFFKPELTKGINLVVLPKAIGRIPSACGSSVPACPILLILNFFFYFFYSKKWTNIFWFV